jgi:hypothetical protein
MLCDRPGAAFTDVGRAEIDKRVEAKLGAPAQFPLACGGCQPGRHQALWVGAGTGAGITGLVAIIAEHGSKTVVAAMITVWVILAVAGPGTAAVNRYGLPDGVKGQQHGDGPRLARTEQAHVYSPPACRPGSPLAHQTRDRRARGWATSRSGSRWTRRPTPPVRSTNTTARCQR